MIITAFDAGDGDCLLLTGSGGGTVLFDGGRKGTFRANAAVRIGLEPKLDLVCVTHVDNDHIQGIVELVDRLQQQRRFEYHQAQTDPNPNLKPPDPVPEISELWHNAFHTMVGDDGVEVSRVLAAQRQAFATAFNDDGDLRTGSRNQAAIAALRSSDVLTLRNLATGYFQGIELDKKLHTIKGITMNGGFDGGFVERPGGDDPSVPAKNVGSLDLHVLAPTAADITDFEDEWRKWAEDNVARIQDLERDVSSWMFTTADGQPRVVEAARRSSLTPQNLVSIVVLVEDGGATALFTGDAAQQDILAGLEVHGALDQEGPDGVSIGHLNALKVQHHGSPNNLDNLFSTRVTADHYVFCGNGSHGNPSKQVIDYIIDSRVKTKRSKRRSHTAEAENPFHLWFTANPDKTSSQKRRDHMNSIFEHVSERIEETPHRFGASALSTRPSLEIDPLSSPIVGELRRL